MPLVPSRRAEPVGGEHATMTCMDKMALANCCDCTVIIRRKRSYEGENNYTPRRPKTNGGQHIVARAKMQQGEQGKPKHAKHASHRVERHDLRAIEDVEREVAAQNNAPRSG